VFLVAGAGTLAVAVLLVALLPRDALRKGGSDVPPPAP